MEISGKVTWICLCLNSSEYLVHSLPIKSIWFSFLQMTSSHFFPGRVKTSLLCSHTTHITLWRLTLIYLPTSGHPTVAICCLDAFGEGILQYSILVSLAEQCSCTQKMLSTCQMNELIDTLLPGQQQAEIGWMLSLRHRLRMLATLFMYPQLSEIHLL